MKLSVAERYRVLELMPKEGTFTTLKLVRKAREAMSFSEEDLAKYALKEEQLPDGNLRITWNTKAEPAEIDISPSIVELVSKSLRKLDAEGKLTERDTSLYEKFVVET